MTRGFLRILSLPLKKKKIIFQLLKKLFLTLIQGRLYSRVDAETIVMGLIVGE